MRVQFDRVDYRVKFADGVVEVLRWPNGGAAVVVVDARTGDWQQVHIPEEAVRAVAWALLRQVGPGQASKAPEDASSDK